jgi:hypothetical protein
MPMHKIQSFKITMSFKTNVTKEMQKWTVGYLRKMTKYRFVVTELDKSGKVHLHACCIWNKETRGDNIKETLFKGYMKYQKDQSVKKFCIMLNVLYDDKWYQDYLRKDPNRVILENVWGEPDELKQYYPSKEVQEDCQRIGEANKSRNANLDMCTAFQEWVDERGIWNDDAIAAAEWLNRWHMDRYLLIDRKIFRQKLDLLVRSTWNRWRAQEWQKEIAKEYGCYQGGGDVSLRERGVTIFKGDGVFTDEDADHVIFSQTQGELASSSGVQQENPQEPVHSPEEGEQVHEESGSAGEEHEEV